MRIITSRLLMLYAYARSSGGDPSSPRILVAFPPARQHLSQRSMRRASATAWTAGCRETAPREWDICPARARAGRQLHSCSVRSRRLGPRDYREAVRWLNDFAPITQRWAVSHWFRSTRRPALTQGARSLREARKDQFRLTGNRQRATLPPKCWEKDGSIWCSAVQGGRPALVDALAGQVECLLVTRLRPQVKAGTGEAARLR